MDTCGCAHACQSVCCVWVRCRASGVGILAGVYTSLASSGLAGCCVCEQASRQAGRQQDTWIGRRTNCDPSLNSESEYLGRLDSVRHDPISKVHLKSKRKKIWDSSKHTVGLSELAFLGCWTGLDVWNTLWLSSGGYFVDSSCMWLLSN